MSSPDSSTLSPRKRQKLSPTPPAARRDAVTSVLPTETVDRQLPMAPSSGSQGLDHATQMAPSSSESNGDCQLERETEVGITEYVNPHLPRFSGILKKRYTDFLVNEILPSGQVVHLDNLRPPRPDQPGPSNKATTRQYHPGPSNKAPETLNSATAEEKRKVWSDSFQPTVGVAKSVVVAEKASQIDAPRPVAQASKPQPSKEERPLEEEHRGFKLKSDDETEMHSYFGADGLKSLIILYEEILAAPDAKSKTFGTVKSPIITDRDLRTKIHRLVRRIFSSRFETSTDDDGAIVVSCAQAQSQWHANSSQHGRSRPPPGGRPDWKKLGGDHLHFSLYKENKDTMEVISFLARQLKMNIKSFQFAGTKDRRAVTVQRASVYRLQADRLAGLNRSLRGSKVGNYEYNPTGLELGELAGNEFIITLRDCHFPNVGSDGSALGEESSQAIAIRESLNSLSERGFINYFGLQRFGTFSARTDTVGVKMLQGDFEGACSEILSYSPEALAAAQDPLSSMAQNPVSSDDKARAHALHTFKTTGNAAQALENLPYKFSGEWALLRFLGGKDRQSDFQGALQAVPRNLRTMYVHAYQSLVWNVVAGERWRRFGSHVVAGDLVLVNEHKDEGTEMVVDEVDESGEVVVHPAVDDATAAKDDRFERARALTQEEVGSNKYSIFDVVLPTPGFDVLYPANELAEYYKTFMGSDRGGGLDPHDMRRKWKDISLSGNYRKLLARPFGHTRADFELKRYEVDDEQMVQTDLEKLEKRSRDPKPSGAAVDASRPPPKTAVVLRLQLGTGQYATMALRELMGSTGVKTYKPDYGGGR